MDTLTHCLRVYPILDIIFVGLWVIRHYLVWSKWQPDPQQLAVAQSLEERNIAASAVKDSINGSMTGTGIILAAIAAIMGLGKDLSQQVTEHLRVAAAAGVFSLGIAAFSLGGLPSRVNRQNLAYQRDVNLRLVVQLWLLVDAAARLGLAMLSKL